jgi:Tfp pilus assembly protein PilP
MTYHSDVREYITNLEAQASSPLEPLFKHFHAMSYQLAQMRDAFAIARALNRTLVHLSHVVRQV